MNIKELQLHLEGALTAIYPDYESKEITIRLIEHFYGYSKIDIALNPNLEIDNHGAIIKALGQLKAGRPMQYILKKEYFYDLAFGVDENTLIPRPETEELVQLIINRTGNKTVSLLDVGTGSGCIAISLKKNLPNAKVTALDVSDGALNVARKNAKSNVVEVDFMQVDILNEAQHPKLELDIIVSNPPYVLDKEKAEMRNNVLDFEPSLALFVDNDKPLLFYKAIADYATLNLKPLGVLYFEINEAFGIETKEMLEERGFSNVEIHQDIFGKDRMVSASWNKTL